MKDLKKKDLGPPPQKKNKKQQQTNPEAEEGNSLNFDLTTLN